jgi:hypothetical protein
MNVKLAIPFETVESMRRLAHKLYQLGKSDDAYALAGAIADVVQATGAAAFYATATFGACPTCGDCEAVLSIGCKRYGVCHEHRLYWYIGADYLTLNDAIDEHGHNTQMLLGSYRAVPLSDAFAKKSCPCCGLSVTHQPWCIMPDPEFQ